MTRFIQRGVYGAEHEGLRAQARQLERDYREIQAVEHGRNRKAEFAVEDYRHHVAPAAGAGLAEFRRISGEKNWHRIII